MNTATPWEKPDWDDLDALQSWALRRRAYLEKVLAASGPCSVKPRQRARPVQQVKLAARTPVRSSSSRCRGTGLPSQRL